jgi:hypothetical protein
VTIASAEFPSPATAPPSSLRRVIEHIKQEASIETIAAHYGEFKPAGTGRLVGRCISPDHPDRTPSMTLYSRTDTFKCFDCGGQGDVISLVRLAEGCELWEAMMTISQRHGVELPERSQSWFARQHRQGPVRNRIEQCRIDLLQRRIFHWWFLPMVELMDGPEREAEAAILWDEAEQIAQLLYAASRKGPRHEP